MAWQSSKVVFICLLFLVKLTIPALASKKSIAESLARARITDAMLFLSEVNKLELTEECKNQLGSLQAGLLQAEEFLRNENEDEALGELAVVEVSLDSCIESLSKLKTPEGYKVRMNFRKIGRGVSNAELLMKLAKGTNNEGKRNTTIAPSHEVVHDDSYSESNQTITGNLAPNTSNNAETPELASNESQVETPKDSQNSLASGNQDLDDSANSSVQERQDTGEFLPENDLDVNSTTRKDHLPSTQSSPLSGDSLTSVVFDYCADHGSVDDNTVTVQLDKACGAKFHSKTQYQSGVFSAKIRTPAKGAGVSTSFYISSLDEDSDMISFDFVGNTPTRISTNYGVSGHTAGHRQVYVMSFDTSVKFHTYTMKWDSESILWLVDGIVLRTLVKTEQPYPTKAGSIHGLIWDASNVANGAYAGKVDWDQGPYHAYFDSIIVASPITAGSWHPPALVDKVSLRVPQPMRPLAIDYCDANVGVIDTEVSITFDKSGCGGRFRSISTYPSGSFSAKVRCPQGDTSGLLTSFYLSSLEGSSNQDEIDFEWLGSNKNAVQTNYYVNGTGGHETMIDLGFDCSRGYHIYTIKYNKRAIEWLVDHKVVRSISRSESTGAYPAREVYVYASVWNASLVNNGRWTGKWHGNDLPYTALYNDITIHAS